MNEIVVPCPRKTAYRENFHIRKGQRWYATTRARTEDRPRRQLSSIGNDDSTTRGSSGAAGRAVTVHTRSRGDSRFLEASADLWEDLWENSTSSTAARLSCGAVSGGAVSGGAVSGSERSHAPSAQPVPASRWRTVPPEIAPEIAIPEIAPEIAPEMRRTDAPS